MSASAWSMLGAAALALTGCASQQHYVSDADLGARVTGVFVPGAGPPGVAACDGTVTFRWRTHVSSGRGFGPATTEGDEITDVEVQPTGFTVPDHGVPRPILVGQWVAGRMDMTAEEGRPADVYMLRLGGGERIEVRLSPPENAPAVEAEFYQTAFQIYLARGAELVAPRPRSASSPIQFDLPSDGDYRVRVTTARGVPAPYAIGVFRVWDDPNRR